MSAEEEPCGALCPESNGWPYGGVVNCTEPKGHEGDHQARCERRPGRWDYLDSWPNEKKEAHEEAQDPA